MSVSNYRELLSHLGHKLEIVDYAGRNCAIECRKCNVVLIDFGAGEFKIKGPEVDGEALFWSNNDGWVDFASASIFYGEELDVIWPPAQAAAIAWLDDKGEIESLGALPEKTERWFSVIGMYFDPEQTFIDWVLATSAEDAYERTLNKRGHDNMGYRICTVIPGRHTGC